LRRMTLNLASEPARNEVLPNLLLYLACAVVVTLTIQHGLVIRSLPARSSPLHAKIAALETDLARLQKEVATLGDPKPDQAALDEWAVVKDLVDRRTFSWTELFSRLEDVLPAGVRLVSIAPTVKGGQIRLELQAGARSTKDGLDLISALEASPDFDNAVFLSVQKKEDGFDLHYVMNYRQMSRAALQGNTHADAGGSQQAHEALEKGQKGGAS